MKNREGKNRSAFTPLARVPAAVSAVGLFLVVGWFNGRRLIFSPDRDEGYALIQALLVNRGHRLYSEIWSDQPPGYTWGIAAAIRWTGYNPELLRLSTTLLLAIFAWGTFEYCRLTTRRWAGYVGGIVSIFALVFLADMFRYGCAAMISLPSMLFVGFAWLLSARPSSRIGAWLGGISMAIALAIKPLGAPALPAIVLAIYLSNRSRSKSLLALFGDWALAFGLTTTALFWPVFFRDGAVTAYQTHFPAGNDAWPGADDLLRFVKEDLWLFIAATTSSVVLLIQRRREVFSLLLWLGAGAVAISRYEPIWSHHRYLILLPAVLLTGVGVGTLIGMATPASGARGKAIVMAALTCLVAIVSLAFPDDRLSQIQDAFFLDPRPNKVVSLLRNEVPEAKRMVTSRQMYAFRLGLEIPPSQAVTSRKRFNRWKLTSSELTTVSISFDPDIIILDDRWPKGARKKIGAHFSDTHLLVRKSKSELVFVRAGLASKKLVKNANNLKRKPRRKAN